MTLDEGHNHTADCDCLPIRVVVDQHGHYWRDYGDHWSMCPVSTENIATEPMSEFYRAGDLDADIDAVADALNAWDQGEAPRPNTHRHWSRIVAALSPHRWRDASRKLLAEGDDGPNDWPAPLTRSGGQE